MTERLVERHDGICRCTVQCCPQHRVARGTPWRFRDRLVRAAGFHCWDCWRDYWQL